jgi:hypothetical protein
MKAQAGNVTLVAGLMTAVGGLVAAALVMGTPVLSMVIDAETGESGLPLEIPSASSAPATPAASAPAGATLAAPEPIFQAQALQADSAGTAAWPFEQAPASQPAPGAKRADRLSAPEGWTVDGASLVGP